MTEVADDPRLTEYNPVSPTTSFPVGFPLFEDGRFVSSAQYAADLEVWRNGVQQAGNWTLDVNFVDGVDEAAHVIADSGWTGEVLIVGAHPPSRTVQFVDGRGVSAEGYNLAFNIVYATLREMFDYIARGPSYGPAGDVIDFHGARLTGAGNGSAATDVLTKAQVETKIALVASGGIANAATLITYSNASSPGWGATVQQALDDAYDDIAGHTTQLSTQGGRITALENAAGVDVGDIKMTARGTVPTGWLLCDGSAISRSTYSTLFTAIGVNYGAGNGTTTFNIPNFAGRVPVGRDNMSGTAANISQRSTTIDTNSGSPTATVGSGSGLSVGMFVFSANVPDGTTIIARSGATITLSANATASASGTAARISLINDPQSRGGVGGGAVHTMIEDQVAAHRHFAAANVTVASSVAVSASNQIAEDFQSGNGELNYDFSGSATDATVGRTSLTGGGNPHPNMQPSLVVNYLIYAGV